MPLSVERTPRGSPAAPLATPILLAGPRLGYRGTDARCHSAPTVNPQAGSTCGLAERIGLVASRKGLSPVDWDARHRVRDCQARRHLWNQPAWHSVMITWASCNPLHDPRQSPPERRKPASCAQCFSLIESAERFMAPSPAKRWQPARPEHHALCVCDPGRAPVKLEPVVRRPSGTISHLGMKDPAVIDLEDPCATRIRREFAASCSRVGLGSRCAYRPSASRGRTRHTPALPSSFGSAEGLRCGRAT